MDTQWVHSAPKYFRQSGVLSTFIVLGADGGRGWLKQYDFGFIGLFTNIMDIWVQFQIQQMGVHIVEMVTWPFPALIRCHLGGAGG